MLGQPIFVQTWKQALCQRHGLQIWQLARLGRYNENQSDASENYIEPEPMEVLQRKSTSYGTS